MGVRKTHYVHSKHNPENDESVYHYSMLQDASHKKVPGEVGYEPELEVGSKDGVDHVKVGEVKTVHAGVFFRASRSLFIDSYSDFKT